jgi:hypothetical protein
MGTLLSTLLLATSLARATPPPAALAGTWTYDAAASGDPKPMLAKLGVPSFVPTSGGTQVITIEGEKLVVTVDGALGERTETIEFGAVVSGSLLGYPYSVRPVVSGDRVVSTGTIKVGGQSLAFVSIRTVSGSTMTVETTIGTGADAVMLTRVFHRS